MTKYRTISDGYTEHLQYLHEYKFLFIFTIKTWNYIRTPYYDIVWGRSLDSSMYNSYVCRYNTNFEEFIKEWSDINEYFKWAKKEQKRLEDKVLKY